MAQHRTNSFRANATTAFFFEQPLAWSRSQVFRAHGLYRRLHQAHSTNAARRSLGRGG
jgi:hypothetical protein